MPRNENLPGVPLGQLLGEANLLLICLHCQWRETYDLQKVISQLQARGVNGPLIGICDARHHVRQTCPRCGSQKWETRPDYGPYVPPAT
ncbi:hypothetical protein [Caulobacter rhizosphaerae]|uniref:hypothetical protein n=1 Tax=Caulobacter rhizosphaerae TaxID=2010972 RepID=UPI0013D2096D|nr:hypothetical protein [Caulobacter rhizosphaerae]GGL48655.1 hypothetical protein GCM10010983_52440 [Caulobacter rhizosphaerae]